MSGLPFATLLHEQPVLPLPAQPGLDVSRFATGTSPRKSPRWQVVNEPTPPPPEPSTSTFCGDHTEPETPYPPAFGEDTMLPSPSPLTRPAAESGTADVTLNELY